MHKMGFDLGRRLPELFPGSELGLALGLADALLPIQLMRVGQDMFDATVVHQAGEGEDIVAQLAVGDAYFWVANTDPERGRFSAVAIGGGTSRTLLLTSDPDTMVSAARAAGATATSPTGDEHGWRLGRITDPFGHNWEIGTPIGPWPP